jgi:glycosyltransferase involved in cell wall biosynthesis
MKILVLANKVPYPPNDGGALATLNMCLGLNIAGAEIVLLAMSTPKHTTSAENIPDVIAKQINAETVFVDTTISVVSALRNYLFSSLPYNAERFVSKEYKKRLGKILESSTFDIVQLEGLYLAPYIKFIRKKTKSPIALRAHNVEHEIWQRTAANEPNFLRRYYYKHLARRIKRMEIKALRMIDLLIPISERDAQFLNELGYSGSCFVNPTGYDIEDSCNDDIPLEFPSLFHIGALDWHPNREGILWFLDNCWQNIVEELPNLTFYVAGRGAPQDFIGTIQSYKGVEFCGEVVDARKFIQSKALMIVPLLSGSGMRIKIVEGMALGKAVISTSIGAEGIEADHGKQIIIADNPHNFYQEICRLLSDKELLAQIGKDAQLFAKVKLDNNRLTQNLLNYYKSALNDRAIRTKADQ